MTTYSLASPSEERTVTLLATLFTGSDTAQLAVREDLLCNDWITAGSIRVFAAPKDDSAPDNLTPLRRAIGFGAYEWEFPAHDVLLQSAQNALPAASEGKSNKNPTAEPPAPLRRALEHLAFVAARTGLVAPRLDADLLSTLPFRRPTTLVVDTSSIIQGGLDFAVRFLCPAARIRVPAVAHMELLCQTDNYFKIRRNSISRGSAARGLLERACGVGGQRAILRVELHTDAEIERATIGADPLRGIVRLDEEDKALQVEHVQRSFADRLIFETAREHQGRCSPGHRVMLMTCDEGLARMTLGEGMMPFVFRSLTPHDLSRTTLTGCPFDPFSGELRVVPLPDVLWELAVTFGAARLSIGKAEFEVRATAQDLPWRPYHTTRDLLWVKSTTNLTHEVTSSMTSHRHDRSADDQSVDKAHPTKNAPNPSIPKRAGAYKFSLQRMLGLVAAMAQKRKVTTAEAQKALDVGAEHAVDDYRNFLGAGGFCTTSGKYILATDQLDKLWTAFLRADLEGLANLWMTVPSLAAFINELTAMKAILSGKQTSIPDRAVTTYVALSEVAALALSIPDEGIFCTSVNPDPKIFSQLAFDTFHHLSRGLENVSTGAWLEALARDHGVHPVHARARLEEARVAGYLERFTEGSTPETRFERHQFSVLNRRNGQPFIERVNLYHGDFLIVGRASVSLRILLKEGV